ncbi:copper amine oxidase N-terminal domain-containing protein, partial [Desulfofundulus sp.]|uniref:copper amine oxidase N-terminal domain-containing protein n=1 Tax=Desulfofundulus sp. TaxID=2282750 RepID=UPI003C764809
FATQMRAELEALGVAEDDIVWVESTGDVSLKLGDKLVQMRVGSRTLYVNGQAEQMDVAPLVRDGRTYLPARWVAEAFGYEVGWDDSTRAVLVGPPGSLPDLPGASPVQPPAAGGIQPGPFQPLIKSLEMHVGSKVARATRFDGSTFDVTLPVAPVAVAQSKDVKDHYINAYHEVYPPNSFIVDPNVSAPAIYIPFAAVAEAFGVPAGNIKWDGKTLKVYRAFHGSDNDVWTLTVGSTLKGLNDPLRVAYDASGNPVAMMSNEDSRGLLFTVDTANPALLGSFQNIGGDDLTKGISILGGTLYPFKFVPGLNPKWVEQF